MQVCEQPSTSHHLHENVELSHGLVKMVTRFLLCPEAGQLLWRWSSLTGSDQTIECLFRPTVSLGSVSQTFANNTAKSSTSHTNGVVVSTLWNSRNNLVVEPLKHSSSATTKQVQGLHRMLKPLLNFAKNMVLHSFLMASRPLEDSPFTPQSGTLRQWSWVHKSAHLDQVESQQ